MFQRNKVRRFRRRPSGRNHMNQNNGSSQMRPRTNAFSNNGQMRNNFRSQLSPEKLLEKYSTLAKEALTSGDKTLSENYLQHADHFIRVIEDKNKIRNQNKINNSEKNIEPEKKAPESININQDKD